MGRRPGLAALGVCREEGMNTDRARALATLQKELADAGYIAEPSLVAAVLLMQDLGRPLLLEGDAGVGKTEVAKVLAAVRGARLIRLQCYEGLDAHAALYEWNYQRQLLAIKLLEHDERANSRDLAQKEQDIFSERYLLKRPLLEAITCAEPPVLLIDEVDRADAAFEAYLLELLSDFQLSIPELGTVHATSRTVGRDHLQRHARAVGRAAPALPVPVHRLPGLRQGTGDRAQEGAEPRGSSWRSRSSPSCRACGARTCRRSPASPRRSTGPPRCCAWASRRSTPAAPSASSNR